MKLFGAQQRILLRRVFARSEDQTSLHAGLTNIANILYYFSILYIFFSMQIKILQAILFRSISLQHNPTLHQQETEFNKFQKHRSYSK